jgi:hypothetical protein
MRERLNEIICYQIRGECLRYCNHPYCDRVEDITDYLLAEGVIVLPCKVGQTVWFISEFYTQPFQTVITSIEVYEEETVICTLSGTEWHYEDFGKTVFLTKEEAEQALDKLKGK